MLLPSPSPVGESGLQDTQSQSRFRDITVALHDDTNLSPWLRIPWKMGGERIYINSAYFIGLPAHP